MNGTSQQHAIRRIGQDFAALAAGAGIGAGLMYLLDPKRGRSRRTHLIGGAAGLLHRRERKLGKRATDFLNRIHGLGVIAAEAIAPRKLPSDEVLQERIRSRMGHIVADPQEIEVRVEDGVVTLEGELTHPERRRLKEEVRAMPGVKKIDAHLGHLAVMSPGVLIGLGAALALFRKHNPLTVRTNAAQ